METPAETIHRLSEYVDSLQLKLIKEKGRNAELVNSIAKIHQRNIDVLSELKRILGDKN